MEIVKDENLEYEKWMDYYEQAERKQYIGNLDVDESVTIITKDKDGKIVNTKTFTAKFINCHFNLQWQDKGGKATEELYEYVRQRKA